MFAILSSVNSTFRNSFTNLFNNLSNIIFIHLPKQVSSRHASARLFKSDGCTIFNTMKIFTMIILIIKMTSIMKVEGRCPGCGEEIIDRYLVQVILDISLSINHDSYYLDILLSWLFIYSWYLFRVISWKLNV